ncbi:MAG: cytidylate kinase-like family protein [Chloroflexi bacterium]|nr:cytidylate kinase-like family protein [Chloroflexota bacterium]
MPVVTVAGMAGAGARELGPEVARLLKADYVDQKIMQEAAHRIGTTAEALAHRDERVHSLGHRLARLMENLLEKSAYSSDPFFDPAGVEVLLSRSYEEAARNPQTKAEEVNDARFIEIVSSVMRGEAQTGNAVILGRGGQMVLRDIPTACHIFVVGPVAQRIEWAMRRERLDRVAAERWVRQVDADRVAYHRKFWKVDIADPLLYDIVINTEEVTVPGAAEIVAKVAQVKAASVKAPA